MISQKEINQKRIQGIFQMLLEISRGNFSYKIKRTADCNDDLEALIIWLNMTTEEIHAAFSYYAYINPRHSYECWSPMAFILNDTYKIKNFNIGVSNFLGRKRNELQNRDFESLLAKESIPAWQVAKDKIIRLEQYTVQLIFTVKHQLFIPAFCTFSRLNENDQSSDILVTSTEFILQDKLLEQSIPIFHVNGAEISPKPKSSDFTKRNRDIQLVQKIYDYILENLEKPIPSIEQLSSDFGIGKTKLKTVFKQLFNTTIFHFYRNERLKKARLLISNSDFPLTQIAKMCGFLNYPNFSKAFKKKFSLSPQQFKKRLSEI